MSNKHEPGRLIVYQQSKAANPWAVEIERLNGKHAKQDFSFRIFSEGFNGLASDWMIVNTADLNAITNNICNCLKMLRCCNCEVTLFESEPIDYAHIRQEMHKTFFN